MKKFLFLALGLSVLLTACLVDDEKEGKAYRVVIADRVFKVPEGYFDGLKPSGKDTESAVIEYELPGFKVLPKNKVERRTLISEGRMRGMLLENASKRINAAAMVENRLNGRAHFTMTSDNIFGLEKYTAPTPDGAYANKPDDLFLEKNGSGDIQSFLECSAPNTVKIPSCRHVFANKGLLYRIHWRISELPNWKEQQAAAIAFIDSLEVRSGINDEELER